MPSNPLELNLPPLKILDIDCLSKSSHIKAVTIFIQNKIFTFLGNGKGVHMKTPDGKTTITVEGFSTPQPVTIVILHAATGHGKDANKALGFFKLSSLTTSTSSGPMHSFVNVMATDPITKTEECHLTFMYSS